MNIETDDKLVIIGYVSRPHGVHGALVITPHSDNYELILAGQDLFLIPPDGGAPKPVDGLKGKEAAQGLIVKIKNITTRDAAQNYKGWSLAIPRQKLPPTEDDEYYWADLLGLTVLTTEGETLGQVENFMDTGAGLILVVVAPQQPEREILIPFRDPFVVQVDLPNKRLTIEPVPGLLDLP